MVWPRMMKRFYVSACRRRTHGVPRVPYRRLLRYGNLSGRRRPCVGAMRKAIIEGPITSVADKTTGLKVVLFPASFVSFELRDGRVDLVLAPEIVP
jgi:hypothetical protein